MRYLVRLTHTPESLGVPVSRGAFATALRTFRAVVIPELRWAWPHASDMEEQQSPR